MHCPQCGRQTPVGAAVCPQCGFALDDGPTVVRTAVAGSGAARTMLGGVTPAEVAAAARNAAGPGPPASAPATGPARTMLGMPHNDIQAAVEAARSAQGGPSRTIVGHAAPKGLAAGYGAAPAAQQGPARTLLGGVGRLQAQDDAATAARYRPEPPDDPTILRVKAAPGPPQHAGYGLDDAGMGVSTLVAGTPAGVSASAPGVVAQEQAGPARTLLGVARPGIAPIAPGVERPSSFEDDELAPASELGATMGPAAIPRIRAELKVAGLDRRIRDPRDARVSERSLKKRSSPKRPKSRRPVILVVAAAGALALVAVLVALLWQSAPPIVARPKADAQGREGVEVKCATCPDGTKISIGGSSATTTGKVALVPLPTELTVGENRLKVAIVRPGAKREEIVPVTVSVGYRIRPDLATLQGERPAIGIVAEAARGTTITLDGKPLPLVDGRGTERFDVSEALSGVAGDVKTLTRQVPYVVTPADGPPEAGIVNVSVGVVPLHIEAPGPRVTTDQATFILAGHTARGAEVLAAGRPIPVKPDGTFAQVMNVSSVGATQIEVRARMPGMAPRLSPIRVRRVENLDVAARDFAADNPVDYQALAPSSAAAVGKAVVLSGEVLDVRRQGYATIILLDVSKASGCAAKGCNVRLVLGGETTYKKGDKVKAYGRVAPPFAGAGVEVPEVELEFLTKDRP